MAEDQARRPPEFSPVQVSPPPEVRFCPFCEGNESSAPGEIMAVRQSNTSANDPGWSLRVVPNKSAILRIEGDIERRGDGIYDLMKGVGAHEVLIETPRHDARMGEYSQAKMEEVVRAYHERVMDLHRDKRFKYIQIFRNYGAVAGARLEHPHSQIIALPITPRWVKEELINAQSHYDYKERCLFCDIVNQEGRDGVRVVFENQSFLAFCPFASKFPFETWILPKYHDHDFKGTPDSEFAPLAEVMRRTLFAIQRALENPPYNFIVHSAPILGESHRETRVHKDYHWHIEIIPRISRIAGFEWGTGFYVNPTQPEAAAEYMRSLIAERPDPEEPVD